MSPSPYCTRAIGLTQSQARASSINRSIFLRPSPAPKPRPRKADSAKLRLILKNKDDIRASPRTYFQDQAAYLKLIPWLGISLARPGEQLRSRAPRPSTHGQRML